MLNFYLEVFLRGKISTGFRDFEKKFTAKIKDQNCVSNFTLV